MVEVTAAGIARQKAASRIEDVLGERGLTLKRKGKQRFALCPFHKAKTPSFCVTPGGEEGRYHCFGCSESGDVIGFLVKQERLTFRSAVKELCRRGGLRFEEVLEEDPKRKPRPQPKTPASKSATSPASEDKPGQLAPAAALGLVVNHYHRKLGEHPEALEYLSTKRGLADLDLLRVLRVGYADGSLLKAIPKSGPLRQQL